MRDSYLLLREQEIDKCMIRASQQLVTRGLELMEP